MICAVEDAKKESAKEKEKEISQIRKVSIGVDSGAAVSVWPKDLCADYPTRKTKATGTKYATAGKDSKYIVNEGERTMVMKTADGSRRGAKVQIAAVRKPLMSVADMVDAGQDVHFLASGQHYAVHRATGAVTSFVRRKNVFEIDAEIPTFRRHP